MLRITGIVIFGKVKGFKMNIQEKIKVLGLESQLELSNVKSFIDKKKLVGLFDKKDNLQDKLELIKNDSSLVIVVLVRNKDKASDKGKDAPNLKEKHIYDKTYTGWYKYSYLENLAGKDFEFLAIQYIDKNINLAFFKAKEIKAEKEIKKDEKKDK